MEKEANLRLDHALYNLKPRHRFFSGHPSVNDLLPNAILSGQLTIKGDIEEVRGGEVEFADGSVEEVDEIILSTGYKFRFPFLHKDLISWEGENRVKLYKFVFPPELTHPSLAFIGYIQPIGAIQPISEQQARWAVAVIKGVQQLPKPQEMEADYVKKDKVMRRRYFDSPKHTIQVDYVEYMDEISEIYGNNPLSLKLLLSDPRLGLALVMGPTTPYHFRLCGRGAWAGARQAILSAPDRIRAPLGSQHRPRTAPLFLHGLINTNLLTRCVCILVVVVVGVCGGAEVGRTALLLLLASITLYVLEMLLDYSALFSLLS